MTSEIDTIGLNQNYPVAGEDNDSQGFRDNFTNIKTNLDTAKSEITDLQNNVIRSDGDNDFNGVEVSNANFIRTTKASYGQINVDGATTGGTWNIDFENGHSQAFVLETDIQFIFVNWPDSDKYAEILVHLYSDQNGTTRTVTNWTDTGTGAQVKIDSNWPNAGSTPPNAEVSTDDQTDPVVIKFWTYDGGDEIFGQYLGKFTSV